MKRKLFLAASTGLGAGLYPPSNARATNASTSDQQVGLNAEYEKFEEFLSFLRGRNASQYATTPATGIYEERYVEIGGIEQWITIHGMNRGNPVLLFVHGGPGDVTNPWSFVAFSPWLKFFTLVQWDQRGAGMTLRKNGDGIASTLTLDRMTQDGVELANYLCSRLDKRKIVIVCHSFGTILGLMMARRASDKLYAYVGTGQVGDSTKTYFVAFDALLAHARALGNQEAIDELTQVGPPPYSSGAGYAVQRKWSNTFEDADEFLFGNIGLTIVAPGGSVASVNDEAAGEVLSADRLVPQTSTLTPRDLGLEFSIPMYCIQGENDFTTPTSLARSYFDSIESPRKDFVTIANGGHFSVFVHSDEFLSQLVRMLDQA